VKEKMNSKRQVSTFAIALLMAGLVIGIGLSVSTCYARARAVKDILDYLEETKPEEAV